MSGRSIATILVTALTHAVIAFSVALSHSAYASGDTTLLQYFNAYMGILFAAVASIGVWVGVRSRLVPTPWLLAALVAAAALLGSLPLLLGYGERVDAVGLPLTKWIVVSQVLLVLWQVSQWQARRKRTRLVA
jgi:uncharacterized membrane protein YfcA